MGRLIGDLFLSAIASKHASIYSVKHWLVSTSWYVVNNVASEGSLLNFCLQYIWEERRLV